MGEIDEGLSQWLATQPSFGRKVMPCGHVIDWSGTEPERDDCELEQRLSEIERRLDALAHQEAGEEPTT